MRSPAILATILGVALLGQAVAPMAQAESKKKSTVVDQTSSKLPPLTPNERTLHALNRLTFGPRPGDVDLVNSMGLDQWIDLQLHPERIDDANMRAILTQLPAMQLSESKLIEKFPPGPVLRRMEKDHSSLPRDPIEHAIYANQIAYIRANEKEQATKNVAQTPTAAPAAMTETNSAGASTMMASNTTASNTGPPMMAENPEKIVEAKPNTEDMAPEELASLQADKARILALEPGPRFQALLELTPGEPRKLMQKMKPMEKLALVDGFTPEQKEYAIALADTNRVVGGEEMEAKLLYEIYSQRQLQEVMADFWLNHFNVYVKKSGIAPWQIATYERDVIRPRALGKFEDLLRAVATSPAMMEYLDNAESVGPYSDAVLGTEHDRSGMHYGAAAKPGRGLNENYARELMELHTLGVDGGYTQQDVTQVARVFTGWGVSPPRDGGEFEYVQRRHEHGQKLVLGKMINENGQLEGFQVLHILATQPATAHFISRKIAIRFVSDNPSPQLVDAMAQTFLDSKGDIREVLSTMLHSKEFWARESYRAKMKTPLEYVVSSIRATQTDASHPQALISSLDQMGMPLYGMQPPTGYSELADHWVNSAALLTRMNFGLALAANKLPGLQCDLTAITGATGAAAHADPKLDEARLEEVLLHGVVAAKTHQTVLDEMEKLPEQEQAVADAKKAQNNPAPADPLNTGLSARKNQPARNVNLNVSLVGSTESSIAAGLLLGSPDFQRR